MEENKRIKAEFENFKNKLDERLEYIQNKENEQNIRDKKISQRQLFLEKQQIKINKQEVEVKVYEEQIKELKKSNLSDKILIQSQKLEFELTEKKERQKYENQIDCLKNELQEQKLHIENLSDFNISSLSSQNLSNRCN
jgi:hypothetical protein